MACEGERKIVRDIGSDGGRKGERIGYLKRILVYKNRFGRISLNFITSAS